MPFRLTSCKFVFALDRSYKTAPVSVMLYLFQINVAEPSLNFGWDGDTE